MISRDRDGSGTPAWLLVALAVVVLVCAAVVIGLGVWSGPPGPFPGK